MIIFYSVILGFRNWAIYLGFTGYMPQTEPMPDITECKSKYKPYYLLYDDYICRADA